MMCLSMQKDMKNLYQIQDPSGETLMGTRKTIRFYDNPKDAKALDALKDYKNYGFDNENQMVVTALYEFIEHRTTAQTSYSPNELASAP